MYPATSGHESDIPVTSRQILQPFCTERLLPANHSLSIDAIKQHQHAYQNDGKGDSNTLGTAAAMQALKMFTQSNNSASSVSGQGALLGMAMTEASKVGLLLCLHLRLHVCLLSVFPLSSRCSSSSFFFFFPLGRFCLTLARRLLPSLPRRS